MGSWDRMVFSRGIGWSGKFSMKLQICVLAMVLSKYSVRVVGECMHALFVIWGIFCDPPFFAIM